MDKPSDKYWAFCVYLVLALATFAVYWQVHKCDFVNYDDTDYVTENQYVQAGLTRDSITWAFTSGHSGNWHPLTWLSHMLDSQLFGTEKPGWHHLTNLLLHIANTLLLFAVFRRMTRSLWQSAFVAAAFALHPLHVESVAWVSERKDVLSTLFWMLTMAAYLRYVERPRAGRYLLTLLLFALGLMAKPMLVTLPFVLLLLDYWPLSRFHFGQVVENVSRHSRKFVNTPSHRKLFYHFVWEKVPFFVLSTISSIITFLIQRSGGAVKAAALQIRIANASISYVKYITKMIWPAHLAAFYPHLRDALPMWQAAVAALILAAITVCVIWTGRRQRWLVVGWLWYLGTLVPVIGLLQVGTQAMADRYTYLPIIGLFIIAAWGLPQLLKPSRYKKIVLAVAAGAAIPAMMICTWRQVSHWRNSYTLFSHAVKVTKNNYVAHHGLGTALYKQRRYKDAIFHYKQTLKINPDHANAPGNMGLALLQLAEYDEAAGQFREALSRHGKLQKWHLGLGIVLQKKGRLDQAVQHFNQALRIRPDYPRARKQLADALFAQKNFEQAIVEYQQVLRILPRDVSTHNDIGVAFVRLGRLDDALPYFTKALQLKPDSPDAHNNLGYVLVRQDKVDGAIRHFTEAMRLNPDWVGPMNNLAWLLATYKQAEFRNPKEAIRLAEKACHLTEYKNPGLMDTLAAAYAGAGRFSDAVVTLERALELAEPSGQNKLVDEIRNRLRLYKAARPYIEHSPNYTQK